MTNDLAALRRRANDNLANKTAKRAAEAKRLSRIADAAIRKAERLDTRTSAKEAKALRQRLRDIAQTERDIASDPFYEGTGADEELDHERDTIWERLSELEGYMR